MKNLAVVPLALFAMLSVNRFAQITAHALSTQDRQASEERFMQECHMRVGATMKGSLAKMKNKVEAQCEAELAK
jgi:hypothetical protein